MLKYQKQTENLRAPPAIRSRCEVQAIMKSLGGSHQIYTIYREK